MTLFEIKKVLNSFQLDEFRLGHGSGGEFSNLKKFRILIEILEPIPFIRAQKELMKKSFIFSTVADQLKYDGNDRWSLGSAADEIIIATKALREALDQILPEQDEKTVSFKLPKEGDFNEVIQDLAAINTAIVQNVVNEKISGVVVVKSWLPGSLWIDLYLGSTAAVTLVGGIAWSAAVVRKKWHEASIMEKIADSMDIKNQMLDGIKEGVKEHIKLVIESEAKNLLSHNFAEADNHEQIGRLKLAIKTFADLVERGAEVHPALKAPEQVKNLFPDFTKLDVIESKTKLLKEKSDSVQAATK
jgi:hypothetical protein